MKKLGLPIQILLGLIFGIIVGLVYSGTAVGFSTAITRDASDTSTFLSPTIMANYGLAVTLYICGALFFIGFLLCLFMAPETKNMSLAESSSIKKGTTQRVDTFALRKNG
ncbi:hypothetical protein [Neobacillus sp. SuZ13]|uniref:hypothetical protein n=1 Tax=Neobacillus sp. SuZ13 TaxID=3047875 RepID=UPI0024BF3127|nr:hypothetical protein [Neobacillus sp. SuZ13]WHY68401.1 hypothetical protein QNH17_07160 [Neobacillus sp. SuZ13]